MKKLLSGLIQIVLIGAVFVVCAAAGVMIYFKVIERPMEIRAEGNVSGDGLKHIHGKIGSTTIPEGIVIDIQPNGGGL